MLAIIGVRIYVDNFAMKIDQANGLDTGDYKVASYTSYMIFCGFYLSVASIIMHVVLNRVWSDKTQSTCKKIWFFILDPVAYIVVPFLMIPFIVFCVGSFLPDYDNSEFDIDLHAKNAAMYLGVAFIVIFIFDNISATVAFGILLVAITVIVIIIAIILAIILAIVLVIIAIILELITIVIGIIVTAIGLIISGSIILGVLILIGLFGFCCCFIINMIDCYLTYHMIID